MRNLLYIVFALFMSVSLSAQVEGENNNEEEAKPVRRSVIPAETTEATETAEVTETTKVADKNVRTSATIYNEATAEMRMKKYAAAVPLFEEAIRMAKLNPTDSTNIKTLRLANKNGSRAAYGYASALYKEQKYKEMLAMAKRGTEMDDDYYANYINLAKALEKLDRKEEATGAYLQAASFSEAAERPADKIASLYRKAFGPLYNAKKFDKIIELVKANKGALEVAAINYYVAKAYGSKGSDSMDKAIKHAAKAGELGKKPKELSKYYSYLGELYRKSTKVDKAIEAYKKVPKGSKYYAQAQYNITKLKN